MQIYVPMDRIVGKGRPRFTRNGHTYTPDATSAAERLIAACARGSEYKHTIEAPRAVSVLLEAIYPVPKSWPKSKRKLALAGDLVPVVKPDLDNVVKLALDALNGVAYEDDAQVAAIGALKAYESEARPSGLYITIAELEDD